MPSCVTDNKMSMTSILAVDARDGHIQNSESFEKSQLVTGRMTRNKLNFRAK